MNRKISVIGLGYVGLPVAVAFGRKSRTIGFDVNPERIRELREGHDRTGEVTSEELAETDLYFTDSIDELRKADFHIVAVPTPVDEAKRPDLSILLKASETVGKALKKTTSSSLNQLSIPVPPKKIAFQPWNRSPG